MSELVLSRNQIINLPFMKYLRKDTEGIERLSDSLVGVEREIDSETRITISSCNSKLGMTQNFNFPLTTCKPGIPCMREGCYAKNGNFRFSSVQVSLFRNYFLWLTRPDDVERQLLDCPKGRYWRWFSSGDCPDDRFMELIAKVAAESPKTYFWMPTKQYEIVNRFLDHNEKPENLTIIPSSWPNYPADNPHGLPTSVVLEHYNPVPQGAFVCPGNRVGCEKCRKCWRAKPGDTIVYYKH